MRARFFAATLAAVATAIGSLAGCSSDSGGGIGNLVPGGATVIDALLKQAGYTQVQVVELPDGKVAAWTLVPGMKNCPVRLVEESMTSYRPDKLQKPDGTFVPLTNMPANPGPTEVFKQITADPATAVVCAGDQQAPPQLPTDNTP